MKPRAIRDGAEVAARAGALGASLLHQRERLGARKNLPPAACQLRPDGRRGECADRLDAKIRPVVALARQPLDERVSDG